MKLSEKWRQKLHLEPPVGWLNDPNGLSFFKGKYHVYFQYAPDDAQGNAKKCWGHYESKNLTDWEFTGTVLVPDIPEDKDGVYSGCAYVNDDMLNIFYTGNVKENGNFDYITAGRQGNVIMVTSRDGHAMSAKKVLLTNSDYPKNCSCHVRDPKVWKEDEGYKMVLGARMLDDEGAVLLYESDNLTDWKYRTTVTIPGFGYMWECPDYFNVDGHGYLSISPQGLSYEKYRFQNVYSSGYFKCADILKGEDNLSDFEEWDYGFDFYAPQTFEAPDGRRIMIGWMGIGDIPYSNKTVQLGWQHCLTIPRHITADRDGTLLQNPVVELEKLRGQEYILSSGESRNFMLPFELIARTGEAFDITFKDIANISYKDGIVILMFTDMDVSGNRTCRRVKLERCTDIRLIADMSGIEIYLDGGRKVMSSRFYPEDENVVVSVSGIDARIYALNKMGVVINGK